MVFPGASTAESRMTLFYSKGICSLLEIPRVQKCTKSHPPFLLTPPPPPNSTPGGSCWGWVVCCVSPDVFKTMKRYICIFYRNHTYGDLSPFASPPRLRHYSLFFLPCSVSGRPTPTDGSTLPPWPLASGWVGWWEALLEDGRAGGERGHGMYSASSPSCFFPTCLILKVVGLPRGHSSSSSSHWATGTLSLPLAPEAEAWQGLPEVASWVIHSSIGSFIRAAALCLAPTRRHFPTFLQVSY